jgi:hypothetical protein
MCADIWLLPGVTPSMKLEVARCRESFVTLQTSKWLLPVVRPSMKFEFASCREDLVTLQTYIVLLPGVSFDVCLQGP